MRRTSAGIAALVLLTACFGPDPNLTPSGKGKPYVTVQFPQQVEAGTVHTAVVEIENPGPGNIDKLSVTFSLVGRASSEGGVPDPLVGPGAEGSNDAIVSVDPEPVGISEDGVVYFFDGLGEGDTKTIEFDIRVPTVRGDAANAVIVADAEDVERARGASMETVVQ